MNFVTNVLKKYIQSDSTQKKENVRELEPDDESPNKENPKYSSPGRMSPKQDVGSGVKKTKGSKPRLSLLKDFDPLYSSPIVQRKFSKSIDETTENNSPIEIVNDFEDNVDGEIFFETETDFAENNKNISNSNSEDINKHSGSANVSSEHNLNEEVVTNLLNGSANTNTSDIVKLKSDLSTSNENIKEPTGEDSGFDDENVNKTQVLNTTVEIPLNSSIQESNNSIDNDDIDPTCNSDICSNTTVDLNKDSAVNVSSADDFCAEPDLETVNPNSTIVIDTENEPEINNDNSTLVTDSEVAPFTEKKSIKDISDKSLLSQLLDDIVEQTEKISLDSSLAKSGDSVKEIIKPTLEKELDITSTDSKLYESIIEETIPEDVQNENNETSDTVEESVISNQSEETPEILEVTCGKEIEKAFPEKSPTNRIKQSDQVDSVNLNQESVSENYSENQEKKESDHQEENETDKVSVIANQGALSEDSSKKNLDNDSVESVNEAKFSTVISPKNSIEEITTEKQNIKDKETTFSEISSETSNVDVVCEKQVERLSLLNDSDIIFVNEEKPLCEKIINSKPQENSEHISDNNDIVFVQKEKKLVSDIQEVSLNQLDESADVVFVKEEKKSVFTETQDENLNQLDKGDDTFVKEENNSEKIVTETQEEKVNQLDESDDVVFVKKETNSAETVIETQEENLNQLKERNDVLVKQQIPVSSKDPLSNLQKKNQQPHINMADINEKLSQLQQEVSDLKLQLNASQQAKTSLELEISKKEEVIIKTQAEALKNEQAYQLELKQLKEKLKEKSKVIEKGGYKELEEALKAAKAREAQAISELNARNKDELNYQKIMAEYESALAKRVADYQNLQEENETATRHLANLELAFSDVHQKYERTKSVVEGFKTNEQTLRANLQMTQDTLRQHEERYESLKAHAKAQIEKSNKEIILTKSTYESELSKLKAIIKRLEIKSAALEDSLQQKTSECDALAALCDEVTGKRV